MSAGRPDPPELSSRDLLRVLELSEALTRTREWGVLIDRVLDAAIELVGAERGFIILEEGKPDPAALAELRIRAARNFDRERLNQADLKFSRSVVRKALRRQRCVLLGDAAQDPAFRDEGSVQRLRLRSVLCVPLRIGGEACGVVYVDNRFVKGAFDAAHRRLLELLGAQASVALETQALLAEQARLAAENEELSLGLQRLLDEREAELQGLWQDLEQVRAGEAPVEVGIVGRSESLRAALQLLEKVASSQEHTLVLGESGTGKELAARAVHRLSGRRGRFVAINCAAIPDSLLESELFGHMRGSWTGAVKDREGLFVAAHGGTLFLDEVGETSPAMQAKLLRVLQEGEVRPVGGERDRKVDVRVVAATNRDLRAGVVEGTFREDLYYRLAVLPIALPPLREREGDVRLLAEHFLAGCVERSGRGPHAFSDGSLRRLEGYAWPGNVRELENVVRGAHALAAGRPSIVSRDLAQLLEAPSGGPAPTPGEGGGGVRPLDEAERGEIRKALAQSGNHIGKAAKLLGIHRSTLYRKLQRYGMRPG